MILGTFHTEVSNEVNRGTSYDSFIPLRAETAARRIERNYTLKHMERFVTFTQAATLECPRAIPFPNTRIKSIKFLRYLNGDSEFQHLKQVDPAQILSHAEGEPTAFWLDGKDYIWLDCDFDEDIDFEFSFIEYSAWDRTNDNYENWLIDHAFDLLLAQTMMLMAPICREDAWLGTYGDMKREAERTLFIADQELRESVTDDSMIYGG